MTKRLFLGIPLPTLEKYSLFTSIEPIQLISPDWRWVEKKNYHITVSFFGEIEKSYTSTLNELVMSIISNTEQFSIVLNKLILAPPNNTPRMLWAIQENNLEFTSLVSEVEKSISKHLALPNYRKDHRALPHVTLARFDSKAVDQSLITLPDIRVIIPVTSCTLFESILTSKGPTYRVFKEYSLAE